MKITKVDVFMLDAGSQRWQRKPIVCRIYTDEGIYGDGEAGIAFGIGSTHRSVWHGKRPGRPDCWHGSDEY